MFYYISRGKDPSIF